MVGWHHWLNGHEFEQAHEGQELLQSMGSQSQTTQQRDLNKANSFLRMQPRLTLPLPPPVRVPVAAASAPSPAVVPSVCAGLPCWVCPFPFMFQNWSHTLPWCKTSLILQNLIGHLSHDYNPQRGINFTGILMES